MSAIKILGIINMQEHEITEKYILYHFILQWNKQLK